MHNAVQLMQ